MVRAEKYIRFSQVTEGFLGASLQFEKGIIINSLQFIVYRLLVTIYSLQFTACWLKSVPSKVFAMVVRDGTARGKESL